LGRGTRPGPTLAATAPVSSVARMCLASARGHLVRFGLREAEKVDRVKARPDNSLDCLSGRDVRAPQNAYRRSATRDVGAIGPRTEVHGYRRSAAPRRLRDDSRI